LLKWLKNLFKREDTKRAERGAALLDHYYPGWATLVETDKLNMKSGTDCILGQVFGGYSIGSADLFGNASENPNRADDLTYHGFFVKNKNKGENAWKKEVQNRTS